VEAEVGKERVDCIRALREWLYETPRGVPLPCRAAPSIVARSEAELLGMSVPRFAYRAYLGPDSFINMRRMKLFLERLRWGRRCGSELPGARLEDIVPLKGANRTKGTLETHRWSAVGDSVLVPPGRLLMDGYHILTSEYGRAYGEHQPIKGTPFLNHIRLGGGLCAQATCLMAIMLLQEYADTIEGVAEIRMRSAEEQYCEIDISGMNEHAIRRYMNSVGLDASMQQKRISAGPDGEPSDADCAMVVDALRSYILSGMPVIIPVDFGRLAGHGGVKKPILSGDGVPVPALKPGDISRPMPHVVLVVGCHDTRRDDFVFNDPATYPFVAATIEQLVDARLYSRNSRPNRKNLLKDFKFLPVVPCEVRTPLLGSVTTEGVEGAYPEGAIGLFQKSGHADRYSGKEWEKKTARERTERYLVGDFRLVNLGLCKGRQWSFIERTAGFMDVGTQEEVIRRVAEGKLKPTWHWLLRHDEEGCLKAWDAQKVLAPGDIGKKPDAVVPFTPARSPKPAIPDNLEGGPGGKGSAGGNEAYPLRVSLLSSFVTRESATVQREWPTIHSQIACDYYVFMQPELRAWAKYRHHRQVPVCAVDVMAECAGNENHTKFWAETICGSFAGGQKIVSLASFIPEISALEYRKPKHRGYVGRRAAVFLVELARALNIMGHKITVVEMVSGSRMARAWWGRHRNDSDGRIRYVVNC